MTTVRRLPLSPVQADRSAGVLLATACGDALGAGYEFGPALAKTAPVGMVGGGAFGWEPGEWTDDTSMAVPLARLAASGADLHADGVLDQVVTEWADWALGAKDVGVQTAAVLRSLRNRSAAAATDSARRFHERSGRSGGNGSLMRTAPVALAFLGDPDGLVEAAFRISGLTHFDPEAGEACAIWCLAIRHAILYGGLEGVRGAIDGLPAARRDVWVGRLDEAESKPPSAFNRNGWVVQALQGAWSAISRTPIPADDLPAGRFPAQHLQLALEEAVRGGGDTDTVAAIAGGLLGARWGVSAVPLEWQRVVHGWPDLRGRELIRMAVLAGRTGRPDSSGWPLAAIQDYSEHGSLNSLTTHPHDSGVLLAGVGALHRLPDGVDAVVSLCRLGAGEVPAPGVERGNHVEVWLVDRAEPESNPHLDFVLTQAAGAVAHLREEGRTVLLHCVQARSRTPTVAALYSAQHLGIPATDALADVLRALPDAQLNPAFAASLDRLGRG